MLEEEEKDKIGERERRCKCWSGEELIIENVKILLLIERSETNCTVMGPCVGERRICILKLKFAKSWRSKKSG